jgi:hypothetical protein
MKLSKHVIDVFAVIILVPYFFAMLVYPLIFHQASWESIQKVWHYWQSLNVGMLAFSASVIALKATRYAAEMQRDRDFSASKAFLPESLDELTACLRECIPLLEEAYARVKDESDRCKTPLVTNAAILSGEYRNTFKECMRYASPNEGDYLASVLLKLQIYLARIEGLKNSFSASSGMIVTTQTIYGRMYDSAELQAMINQLFPFARGMEKFNGLSLDKRKMLGGYFSLNVIPDNYSGLLDFTGKKLSEG